MELNFFIASKVFSLCSAIILVAHNEYLIQVTIVIINILRRQITLFPLSLSSAP